MKFSDPQANGLKKFAEAPWLRQLYEHNVRHVDQVLALLLTGSGQLALQRLGAPVEELIEAGEDLARQRFKASLKAPGGAVPGSRGGLLQSKAPRVFGSLSKDNTFDGMTFGSALPPSARPPAGAQSGPSGGEADAHLLQDGRLPAVRHQGSRGTCVAFTVLALYETMYGLAFPRRQTPQLSPQYLFYWAKRIDGDSHEDGTYLQSGLEALRDHGACPEPRFPYRFRNDFAHEHLFRGPGISVERRRDLAKLEKAAARYRIGKFRRLKGVTVAAIKRELLDGRPVGIVAAVFDNAWYSGFADLRGEIALPLTAPADGGDEILLDTYMGLHAIPIVGYQNNGSAEPEDGQWPGGGFFVFRNSWGDAWARGNDVYSRGYGMLPYAYLNRYVEEAFVIDDPGPAATPPAAAGQKAGPQSGAKKGK